jgi:hypothetical protein
MIAIEQTLYLVYRLSPFIIVCYFILNSLLNQSLNGIVYLCGLLFASVIAVMLKSRVDDNAEKTELCDIMTIGENNSRLTNVPLSLVVFAYTFFYLLMFILEQAARKGGNNLTTTGKGNYDPKHLNQVMRENVAALVVFPLLIIMDVIWIFMNNCVKLPGIVLGIVIGVFIGSMWGMIIVRAKNPDLQILNVGNAQICSRPTKVNYKCKTVST